MLGFLNLYKPTGCTSHDCVAQLRRRLRTKKVGHGGTLDPAAEGVLPIAVGQATRLLPYLSEGKSYHATLRFGVRTTTDDLEGEVLTTAATDTLTLEALQRVLPEFLGSITQIPPAYSAIQVQGKRLYDLARSGQPVTVPPRTVEIFDLKILQWRTTPYPELELAVDCGPGTYIRALARDLGERLGTGATLAHLCRTRSGPFTVGMSMTLENIPDPPCLLSPTLALGHLSTAILTPEQILGWHQGRRLSLVQVALKVKDHCNSVPPSGTIVQVLDSSENFLGLAEIKVSPHTGDLILQPKVVLQGGVAP